MTPILINAVIDEFLFDFEEGVRFMLHVEMMGDGWWMMDDG